jgi:hypothetical protein
VSTLALAGLVGSLLVYSETYAPTVEQSEYPRHTDYTISTMQGARIKRVSNGAGLFASDPLRVSLPPGKYQICAQYTGGAFVTVPIVIEPGKTTVLDLDGEPFPQKSRSPPNAIDNADGRVVGWMATYVGAPSY